jgi:hypothetical protein
MYLRSGRFLADEVIGTWKAAIADAMYAGQFDVVRAVETWSRRGGRLTTAARTDPRTGDVGWPLLVVITAPLPGYASHVPVCASTVISAAMAGERRSLSRQRARFGPMLPTGMPSLALIWAYDGGGSSMSKAISCWQQGGR